MLARAFYVCVCLYASKAFPKETDYSRPHCHACVCVYYYGKRNKLEDEPNNID